MARQPPPATRRGSSVDRTFIGQRGSPSPPAVWELADWRNAGDTRPPTVEALPELASRKPAAVASGKLGAVVRGSPMPLRRETWRVSHRSASRKGSDERSAAAAAAP
eukprot:1631206-Pyramimonas_sp.AAC.1